MANDGGDFDRREALIERLGQGPGEAQAVALQSTEQASPAIVPSRWQLQTIRTAMPDLQGYSLSGVWRLLRRYGLKLRRSRIQQYSPDPDYTAKVAHVMACLRQTAQAPQRMVCLFLDEMAGQSRTSLIMGHCHQIRRLRRGLSLTVGSIARKVGGNFAKLALRDCPDEMGYYRWPEASNQWCQAAPTEIPQTDRQQTKQEQWRLIGVLNALTGQVNYLDGYIVGRSKVSTMYKQVAAAYAWAERVFVVQDNWSIHKHPDVMTALAALPTIEPVWLPTYAPWLNPIEKLWRWLRHDVLKLHRLAKDWPRLRKQVNGFLDQFAHGSQALLRYVGLLGQGTLAQAIRLP